jgi:hypothetical protein
MAREMGMTLPKPEIRNPQPRTRNPNPPVSVGLTLFRVPGLGPRVAALVSGAATPIQGIGFGVNGQGLGCGVRAVPTATAARARSARKSRYIFNHRDIDDTFTVGVPRVVLPHIVLVYRIVCGQVRLGR